MLTRRQILARTALGALGTTGAALGLNLVPDSMPDGRQAKGMVTTASEGAISRGLSYLARQGRNGSFGVHGAYRGNVAMSSMAGMAFMAGGHQPGRGRYGKIVTQCLRYVMGLSRRWGRFNGYLYNPAVGMHGPMYGHGFGALFLGESYGMVHEKRLRAELRQKLTLAIDLIVRSQNREGGWRYRPSSTDADISVTNCQIMALRSARNAGFAVPSKVVDRCVEYVKRCQDRADGSFKYQTRRRGHFGQPFARTAAGVCALYSAGIYKGPEVESGLRYLKNNYPTANGGRFGGLRLRGGRENMQYFYGHYYAAQAMWTRGDDGGRYWSDWFPRIREELLKKQNPDGSLTYQIDTHYATAMACVILQIPNNYLPILQK